jgi:hypothetical protein
MVEKCERVIVRRNVLVGGPAASYPTDNFFPPSLDGVGFVERQRGDYRLAPSSAFKRAGRGERTGTQS